MICAKKVFALGSVVFMETVDVFFFSTISWVLFNACGNAENVTEHVDREEILEIEAWYDTF